MIYCVEDERNIRELLVYTLGTTGFEAKGIRDGKELKKALKEELPELILLDIMLPGADGFELMEYIRPIGTPVIFITAKNALNDRVKGLRMGAEDYIVKPFEILELQARVDGVLRRHGKLDTLISIGGLEINTLSMTVTRDGKNIALTKREYDILLMFAQNPGIVLYKSAIYERVWGSDYPEGTRVVELHTQRMRKKVGWDELIKPVFAVGYRLEV